MNTTSGVRGELESHLRCLPLPCEGRGNLKPVGEARGEGFREKKGPSGPLHLQVPPGLSLLLRCPPRPPPQHPVPSGRRSGEA